MSDVHTPPAGEQAETTPLSEVLAFQNEDRHEVHREAGFDAEPAPADPISAAAPAAVAPTAAPAAPSAQPAPQAETAPVIPATKPENEQPFWYRKELEKERKARQAAEQRASQLEQQRPQPQQQARSAPDALEDPEGYEAHRQTELAQLRLEMRLESSADRFVDKHGDDVFESTREWLMIRPDIEAWATAQRDPWKAAHSQFQKEKLAAEIGEDPNAWRESERERLRQEVLAELSAKPDPEPQHIAAARPPMTRAAPPPPASSVRSAAPRDGGGRFTGPSPMGAILKNRA